MTFEMTFLYAKHFDRRFEAWDCVMIMLQVLSCALQSKKGFEVNHGDSGNGNVAKQFKKGLFSRVMAVKDLYRCKVSFFNG